MKVIFISSGNTPTGISPIVLNQGNSLKSDDVQVEYFTIIGRGARGYLKNIFKLKKFLSSHEYDIVHAHYSISAIVASLAGAKPLVVSLMGSDVRVGKWFNKILRLFNHFFWDACVVKSEDMKITSRISSALVIPNGVDLDKFLELSKQDCRDKLKWKNSKKHILFAANPLRKEKNFSLAQNAIQIIKDPDLELHLLKDIPNIDMPLYYNAADLILLTSFWEGSPNVIKEAMACNCPVVSTDVGDVKEIIGETEGCYLSAYEPEDVAGKIKMALDFGKRTNGRDKIKHLDSKVIADRIISLYKKVISEQK